MGMREEALEEGSRELGMSRAGNSSRFFTAEGDPSGNAKLDGPEILP